MYESNFIIIIFEESWSRTEQYTVKGRHQWTIDNFLHRAQFTEVGDSLCSPIFGVPVDVVGSPKPQELMFQVHSALKLEKKCNFKSTKTHYLHFQIWQKINFASEKSLKIAFLVVLDFFLVQKLIFCHF